MTTLATADRGTEPSDADVTADIEGTLEQYRTELTGYAYRMLGSTVDAEDAVQETMVRAWRSADRFEGRSTLRSWLYRIATNVCVDMLNARKRRARPIDLGPSGVPVSPPGATRADETWVLPIPDSRVLPLDDGDPAELVVQRDSIRLAFVAALQHLPSRQRAVLILREVLQWRASEVAELLDTTVVSVNSALQRARATLADGMVETEPLREMDEAQRSLLRRYVDAFERYDIDALTSLLREDATLSMPPYAMWLRGREDIGRWHLETGAGCRGSRLIPTVANGTPAFGQYRASGPNGEHEPWALQVIEIIGGEIIGLNAFLDTATLFPLFGLPQRLEP